MLTPKRFCQDRRTEFVCLRRRSTTVSPGNKYIKWSAISNAGKIIIIFFILFFFGDHCVWRKSSAATQPPNVYSYRVFNLLVKLLEKLQLCRSVHDRTSPEFLFTRSHTQPAFLGFSETLSFYTEKKEKQSSKVQPPMILHNLKWGALFSSVQAGVIQTETSFGRNLKRDDSSCFDRVQGWQMGINSQKEA